MAHVRVIHFAFADAVQVHGFDAEVAQMLDNERFQRCADVVTINGNFHFNPFIN